MNAPTAHSHLAPQVHQRVVPPELIGALRQGGVEIPELPA